MLHVLRILGAVALAPLLSRVEGAPADWPGWRGAARDGKSSDTGLLKEWPAEGPKLLWKAESIGKGFSSAAVAGGAVYITGDLDGKLVLFAFALDGKPLWKVEHDKAWTASHPGARATPVIDGGVLYLISGNGVIGAYNAKTGDRGWTRTMKEFGGGTPGWGYAESVLIYKNLAVVTPGGKNCIVALNKKTGATLWTSKGNEGGAQYGSCLAFEFGGQPYIVAGTNAGIVCVSAKDGRVQWSNPWSARNTANCPTPAYADGRVFWANGYGKGGICLELKKAGAGITAMEAWSTREFDCHHGGYIIEKGHIYGNHGGSWVCFDLATGAKKWQERSVGKGSLCFADGMLFLFGENGGQAALAAISPEGMRTKGAVSVAGSGPSWAHPVVAGGRLYLRYDTTLYCFDVKTA
ncbi:MAG TPA: polyvinylalcohol dehydrogenase [Planctomycetes bacterium]|nr:polyvinylalcohol dehydrogenase [Planctomycetota bacterium]